MQVINRHWPLQSRGMTYVASMVIGVDDSSPTKSIHSTVFATESLLNTVHLKHEYISTGQTC